MPLLLTVVIDYGKISGPFPIGQVLYQGVQVDFSKGIIHKSSSWSYKQGVYAAPDASLAVKYGSR